MTNNFRGRLAVTASFMVALVMPLTSSAQEGQDQPPARLQVRTVSLNPSGGDTWEGLQTQMAEAHRAAEAETRLVYQEVRGNLDTYHILSFPESMAQFDEQGDNVLGDAFGDWVASIEPTVRERSQTVLRQHQNLSIPMAEDYEPNLLVVTNTRIQGGRRGDYHDWLENKLKPALEAAGMTGVYFSHMNQGGSTSICRMAVHVKNWAALDRRFLPDLSAEERAALYDGVGAMVADSDRRVLRYRADMSN
jgi:hypothetical protein